MRFEIPAICYSLRERLRTYTVFTKALISLGCDEFAMGLRIDSPNHCELSRNVHMVSQSPRMHRELVAIGLPKI